MKILSISIASYNAEKTLEKCLNSIVKSKFIDKLEIIIVNDGSKDNTLNIANKYKNKYPGSVVVIDKENGGHGSTINASIKIATGRYFKIVDSDDWVETENLDRLVELLRTENCDVVVNPYYEVDFKSASKKLILFNDKNIKTDKKFHLSDFEAKKAVTDFSQMHKLTFSIDIVKKIPLIDEHCYYVDIEYVAYCFEFVESIKFMDYPIYDYLLNNENQSVSMKNRIKNRNQLKNVVNKIIVLYENLKETKDCHCDFIKNMVVSQIHCIFMIFLGMQNTEGQREFSDYSMIVPEELLKSIGIKMKSVFFLLRISDFRLYGILSYILNLLKLVK